RKVKTHGRIGLRVKIGGNSQQFLKVIAALLIRTILIRTICAAGGNFSLRFITRRRTRHRLSIDGKSFVVRKCDGRRRARRCVRFISFSLLCGEQRRQNAPRMNDWAAAIATLLILLAPLARAEDFKTVSGKVYKDATVSRIEADGIELRTKTGISKLNPIRFYAAYRRVFVYFPADSFE